MKKDWSAIAAAEAARLYEVLFYSARGTQVSIELVEGCDAVALAESLPLRKLRRLRADADRIAANLQAKGIEHLATAAYAPKNGHAILVTLFRGGATPKAAIGQAWRETFFSRR